MVVLQTERLILRLWTAADREPFAEMNADPRVMRFMPALLTAAESHALADRIEEHFDRHGFGLYALEFQERFIGFTGLSIPSFDSHFTPCVEIGWRIRVEDHNRGFATEAARAVLRHAFDALALGEIVSFTVPANLPSRRVMEKIGMSYDCEFDHPRLPTEHRFSRHVLYRISQPRLSLSSFFCEAPGPVSEC